MTDTDFDPPALCSSLTSGERILLWRLRKGYTQGQAAGMFDVSRYQFRRWEADQTPLENEDIELATKIDTIDDREACVVYRRRDGIESRQIAGLLGLNKGYVASMETGKASSARLVEFWKHRLQRV